MDVWLSYAYISDNIIKNVACYLYTGYTQAIDDARAFCHDLSALAVEVTHIPVQIGDTYEDGVFKRNGEIINPLPTVQNMVDEHTYEIKDANDAIDELIIAITPTNAEVKK